MKRFIAVAIMALAISAWWAVPAVAGCSPGYKVKAPPSRANNDGQGNSDTQERACVPNNQGTTTAQDPSPAISYPCFR
jgi:hypothetical protein